MSDGLLMDSHRKQHSGNMISTLCMGKQSTHSSVEYIIDTFRWYMYYFWILVVGAGASTRLLSLIRNSFAQDQKYQAIPVEGSEPSPRSRDILSLPRSWLKRYLSVPATFGDRCSRPLGWCTIPPRIQSLTIFLFIILNVILCSCSYHLTDGNLYWPKKSTQLTRYVSDRTGIISLVNFPLVWLFGMRNDALMWVTGWGFGTYNAFHRWVARVATIQAVVHSVGYTIMIMESKSSHDCNSRCLNRLTWHRWWLATLYEILDQTLLLEWGTRTYQLIAIIPRPNKTLGNNSYVCSTGIFPLWHSSLPLRSFPRHAHRTLHSRTLDHVLSR